MNKKSFYLFIILFIGLLYFLSPQKIFAGTTYCSLNTSWCQQYIGTPQSPVCCHNTGGCSSPCGPIGWYDYCKVNECCAVYEQTMHDSCSLSDPTCYTNWSWHYYIYAHCSAVDTCFSGNGPYLNAGVCGTSGCEKGGVYKICCSSSGGICPHGCAGAGSNYNGTCGSGCYSVIGSSCSGGGGVTPPPGGGGCLVTPYNNSCPKGYFLSGGCCVCPG